MFTQAERQSLHITTQFSNIVLSMMAGQYRESTLLLPGIFPDSIEKHKKRERNDGNDGNQGSSNTRQRTSATNDRNRSSNTVTPSGSPPTAAAVAPRGVTVFLHKGTPPPLKLPHPGAIFPHPNHGQNRLTVLCCRSAFDGCQCTMIHCS